MDWYWWVLIAVVVLLIIPHFVVSYIVFGIVFKRNSKAEIPYKEKDLTLTDHKDFKDKIYEAIDFLEGLEKEYVSIKSFDGLKLNGFYINNNSDTTVLLVHGYRSMPFNAFNMAAKRLYEDGYNLLFIEQRAHGSSEGVYTSFGLLERKDVKSWCEFINEKYASKNIVLYGSSMGCASVEMALELDMPNNIKAAILDCGFCDVFKLVKSECRKRNPFNIHLTVLTMNLYCKMFAKFSLFDSSSDRGLSKTNVPCFFLTGKDDKVVEFWHVEKNYNACNSYKECAFLDGVDHGMAYYFGYPDLEERIAKFIKKCINE